MADSSPMRSRVAASADAAVADAVSASANSKAARLSAGYQMHVAKPIDPFELAVTVEQLAHGEVAS